MTNSLLTNINNNPASRAIFTPVLGGFYTDSNKKPKFRERFKHYRQDLRDVHSNAFKYTVGSFLALALTSTGAVLGTKNYNAIRRAAFEHAELLKNSPVGKGTTTIMDKAKNLSSKALKWYFNADKARDNWLLRVCELHLGPPGKFIADLSKKSIKFTRDTAQRMWENGGWLSIGLTKKVNDSKPLLSEIISKLPENSQERKAVEHVLGDGLKNGFNEIIDTVDSKVKGIAKEFNNKYFSKDDNPLGWIRKLWNVLNKPGKEGDIARGAWDDAIGELYSEKGIDGTNIGKSMSTIKKMLDKPDLNLSDGVKKSLKEITDKYDEFRNFAVDNYGGRLLDLEEGGGMTEIIVPPVVAAVIAGNTLKGKTNEEKRDNFLKNGGIGFVGGLLTWMGATVVGINGPKGLLIALGSGFIVDNAGSFVTKKISKNNQKSD